MRNLKKFLALILAMMMAMSLMVTANAVNEKENGTNQYTDANTIDSKFVEAVDVLYGMGVMTGDYGAFKGNQYIMRSEMAAVLYRLMTGDTTQLKNQLYADQAADRFEDVDANAWYAPYVGWCYNSGIMVGSNGYFRPNVNVTGYETLVMVLRAMGYGKNHEYTGETWKLYAGSDGTQVGLLKDVSNSNYNNTLSQYTRRDVVASIVFQGAQLPTVTYTPSLGYNKYIGVASAQGSNILNPSLGMTYFGLTSHYGIVVGNMGSGEKGKYSTKIGFSVNPTISKGVNVGSDIGGVSGIAGTVFGTLTGAEITDVIDAAAYMYATSANVDAANTATLPKVAHDAQNVTLAFDRETNLDLFNHKVKVWYDCRGTSSVAVTLEGDNYNTSSVSFGTNCTTYALYDKANAAWVDTAANYAITGDNSLASVFGAGVNTFYNYSFAPMTMDNYGDLTTASAESPIKANNDLADDLTTALSAYPLYLAIDNGSGVADVIISLDLTVSKVVQDNDTQAPFTTGVLTENGSGTAYFDLWDQVNPTLPVGAPADDYSNIANQNMVDSDAVELYDYVAAVTVTGTTAPQNNGISDSSAAPGAAAGDATDGNATPASGMNSTYYYKVDKLVKKETKTLWKYDQVTQECFFSDGTSFKRSIFALAVDGSFQGRDHVKAPNSFRQDYTFYLDKNGDYLFWEIPSASANFVYGTYIDWQTQLASGEFIYPMVYVDAQGKDQLTQNITRVDGQAMGNTLYDQIALPKRDNDTYNSSGFMPGTYIGYAMNGGVLQSVLSATNNGGTATDRSTGFWQADTTNFGMGSRTTIIDANGVAIGAVPVANAVGGAIDGNMNTDNLYLTNSTKFVVVTGAGTATQKADVYTGIADFLSTYSSIEIDATTAPIARTGGYLDNVNPGAPYTSPWDMVYYSLSNEIYDQIYDPSAKVIGTVFIPEQMLTRTAPVSGNLYFVGNPAARIINADDNATLYTMYKDGVGGQYWIDGLLDGAADDDADTVATLGHDVYYQLVDSGRTAYDSGKIYTLLPMTSAEANAQIIGQYYQTTGGVAGAPADTTTVGQTTIDSVPANQGYLATTRNSQVAFIGGRGANFLYNVASANVMNLHPSYTINSLQDLNGQSSLTSNQGVQVSCVLGNNANVVSLIYVNFTQV